MREIKFRGRDSELFLWRYGDLDTKSSPDLVSIIEDCDYAVDPDTVGQFTGLLDSNGQEIYEGDLLEVSPTVYDECKDFKFPVFYHKGAFIVTGGIELGDFLTFGKVTIIGNIHDNPDLVEADDARD